MKKHKLLSISAVIMMLSAYGCSLDEFNPSGISTEQEWSTPAGYEKILSDAGWFHWSGIAASLSQEGADTCLEARSMEIGEVPRIGTDWR